jgi:hypothetical protein
MKITTKPTLGIAIAAAALAATSASATVLFDAQGFEAPAYTLGNLTGQNGWDKDGTGLATVQGAVVQSGSQAVSLTGDTSEWHYPALDYTPAPGEVVRVTSGILRGSSATATKNFGFFLDAYTDDPAFARFARVGLGVSSGNVVALATTIGGSGAGSYIVATGLQWDTWYSFQMDLKFDTQQFDLYIDNTLIQADMPFVVTAHNLTDVDLQKSYTSGATDIGYFDNYKVEVIPEPTAMSLLFLGLAGIGGRAWLGRRQNS